MKHQLTSFVLLICLMAIAFASCKKKGNNSGSCSSGNNFCFELDGTLIEGNAIFREITATRLRVQWETGTGTGYRNVEIDIYANATGTYGVDTSNASGTAALQYFDGEGFYGTTGTVMVDDLSVTAISGTFSGTVTDNQGNSKQITDGNFMSVPKQ